MDSNSLCVNPASKIAAGTFIGLCAGALAVPRRHSLKRVLTQTPDYFDKTFNPTVTSKMTEEEIGAIKILQAGNDTYRTSGKSENKKVRTASKRWYKKYSAVSVDPALTQRLENKKEFLKKAADETGIAEINKQIRTAEKNLSETPYSVTLKEDLANLKKQKKMLEKKLEFPIAEYKEALEAVRKDRMARIEALPNSGLEVKKYYKQMEEAIAKKRTVMSNKLYELTNTPLLKESYNKVKRFLPESRVGNAFKGAAIFGTLTAIWLIFFNPSTRT